jgi:chemosensory pili system protein ChpA (sensor histidine kinase/response regulator)
MKLNELIEALAAEVEVAQPHMAQQLDELARLSPDEDRFIDLVGDYSAQAQRMGEAAEMAGFPGLQSVCGHVLQNSLALPVVEGGERDVLIRFLHGWPTLIAFYLRNIADPSAAEGLVDYLVHAPYPMDEEQARKTMHMLGGMPVQLKLPGGGDEEAVRPVIASAEDVAVDFAEGVDAQLIENFTHEAPEHARYLVVLARNLAGGHGDISDIGAAKRVVHTLKGSGAILGLRGLVALGHHLEDVLEHFEKHGGSMAAAASETLLDAAYCIEQMVGFATGSDDYPGQAQAVLQSVLDLANRVDRGDTLDQPLARPARATAPAAMAPSPAAPSAMPAAALRVSVGRVDELFRLSGEISVHGAAMEVRIKTLADRARELMEQNLRVQKRLFELETAVDVRALTMMRARTQRTVSTAFDPLEMDQYSELHGTSHALMEEAADVRAMSQRLQEDIAQLGGLHTGQQRLAKDLQHVVIGTRMTTAGSLESRLQRTVRSTCQATGKQAALELRGGDTLVDTDVLSQLAEPLLHLLRNAVDHGIEPAEERLAAGKEAGGRIELVFSRQGQQVVLVCRDDGRGLDLPAVRRKAIERGLIEAARELDDEQTARLVLLPGFSTRDQVSEISGRGVGLDVVREWASAMKGSIRITAPQGKGCTIELRFAASLSTQHSLIVEVDGHRLALPSLQVEQAVPQGVGSFDEQGEQLVYRHDKRTLAADRLSDIAGLRGAARTKPLAECHAVIVRHDNGARALAVDRLLDSRELLVKTPGPYARHIRGVAGLSILGDGSVAVNVDIAQLFTSTRTRGAEASAAAVAPTQSARRRRVLVVDDALTVRNALVQLVGDAGFETHTARDGLDAIALLGDFRPDVVLTDLEMPNMNGVELTAHIRGRADIRDLPVIMITSRSQEKHRRLAEEAGVNSYLTKPYNESDLLRLIRAAMTHAA